MQYQEIVSVQLQLLSNSASGLFHSEQVLFKNMYFHCNQIR